MHIRMAGQTDCNQIIEIAHPALRVLDDVVNLKHRRTESATKAAESTALGQDLGSDIIGQLLAHAQRG